MPAIPDKHPPSNRSIRIAAAVFFFISGFAYSAWASRIPAIQAQLHLNEARLGLVLFALPVGLMLTMPITNFLLGRFSSRSIMMAGALSFNITLALPGFTSSVWQLGWILLFFGSSRNLFNLSLNALSVGVQARYKKSIMTTFHGIWSLAGFAGAAAGYLATTFSIGPSYHLPAVGLAMILLSLYFYPKSLYQPPVPKKGKPAFALPDKALLKFSLICFASMACENTMYDWSGIYFHKAVHASKSIATAGFVVYMVAMTAGRFLGDRVVHRLGVKTMLGYSGLLIFSGLLLAAIFPYPLSAGLGFILIGFGVSCVVPLVFSMAGKSESMNSSTAIAAVSTIGYMGYLFVPPFVGLVAEASSLRFSFGLIASLGLLICLMVKQIKPEQS